MTNQNSSKTLPNEEFNLETIDWSNPIKRLNSPKSIEACKRSGIDPNTLYYQDYETFLNSNDDVRSLPREFQELRYKFSERVRKENLRICIDERRRIITDLVRRSDFSSSKINSKQNSNISNYLSRNLDDQEVERIQLQSINNLKEKKRLEIKNKVEQEIKLEDFRKEQETKLEKIIEREERLRQLQLSKKKIEETANLKKEKLLKNLQENEIESLQEINYSKILLDSLQDPSKVLSEMKSRKSFEGKFNSEQNLAEMQKKTLERQRMMEERERIRKENIMQKKIETMIESQKMKEFQMKKVEFAQNQHSIKIISQVNELGRKEKLNEEKKKYFDQLKDMASRRQKEFNMMKSMDMQKSIERRKSLERENIQKFKEKHEKIEKVKQELDNMVKNKGKHRKERANLKLNQMRERKEFEQRLKVDNLLLKFDFLEDRKQRQKQEREREMKYREEIKKLKQNEIVSNLEKISQGYSYLQMKNKEKIQEKKLRSQEFKENISLFRANRSKQISELENKKKEINSKIENILRNPKDVRLNELKELYPEDNELMEKISILKGKSSSSLKNSRILTENNNENYSNVNNSFN